MARDFLIPGESLVEVLLPPGTGLESPAQLGLTSGPSRVVPVFVHKEMPVDDFGPDVGPDTLFRVAWVTITMVVVHTDPQVLDTCLALAMANDGTDGVSAGELQGLDTPMGKGLPLYSEGNCYAGLVLRAPQNNRPWFFPAAYLVNPPLEEPMGVQAQQIPLSWKAIAYRTLAQGELRSKRTRLWHRDSPENLGLLD